ncbi:MAG: hypothetical protein ABI707_09085 [Ferruginibacter sp.]
MSDSAKSGDGYKSNWSMHYGANPKMFELAKELRGRMTDAE